MRLATIRRGAETLPALTLGTEAFPLRDVLAASGSHTSVPSLGDALTVLSDDLLLREARAAAEGLADIVARGGLTPHVRDEIGPPIAQPHKIICVGRNYADHARELGNDLPSRPILFAKFATALRGPFDDVVRPREVQDLDYEAELCVVIGTRGRRIPPDRALDHVFGYCCANDLSAREAQLALGDQWLRGKSFDGFCPIGPAIVSADEITDPQRLGIRCAVDGDTRQDGSTADMVFDFRTLVSYISDAFTLDPGDLILTGTPAGVAMGRHPAPWLQPGQLCEVEIESVGRIANRIVADDVDSFA